MTATPHMRRALELAADAQHSTAPNPMVGAVLARGGEIVGEGRHERAGEPHAEVLALRQAGEKARGATLYVTLEPCSHQGRTGPCADSLIEAGVARVVVALPDPDPRVDGRGIARLRQAGIEVEVGDGAPAAEALNPRWLLSRREHRPFVGLKLAMSLDGRIATAGGESRWITGPASRAEGHRLRAAYAAIAVGAGTVLADDPELTARAPDGRLLDRQPLRLVVDGRLRIPAGARMLDPKLPARALVATSPVGAAARGAEFAARLAIFGSAAEPVRAADGARPEATQVDIHELLRFLHTQEVDSLLIEGGGDLAWSFVSAGVVDHVHAFLAPTLIGGRTAPSAVAGEGFAELADAVRLRFVRIERLGEDILVEAVPQPPDPAESSGQDAGASKAQPAPSGGVAGEGGSPWGRSPWGVPSPDRTPESADLEPLSPAP